MAYNEQKLDIPIEIPTPRIWARKNTDSSNFLDVASLSGTPWSIPEIYAQQFSKDDGLWRTLNPKYELLVFKKAQKPYIGYNLKAKKWLHPVHKNQNNTVKKICRR